MNRCPSCGYIVPGAWTECRRCGAPLALPGRRRCPAAPRSTRPRRIGRAGARAAASAGSAPGHAAPTRARHRRDRLRRARRRAAPRRRAPRHRPRHDAPPRRAGDHASRRARRGRASNGRTIVIAAIVVVCVVGAAFSLIPHGSITQAAAPDDPRSAATVRRHPDEPLGDRADRSGVVAAHRARRRDLGRRPERRAASRSRSSRPRNPATSGSRPSQPSTTNTMISITSAPGIDVIAVSGTNREICAYGRWSPRRARPT